MKQSPNKNATSLDSYFSKALKLIIYSICISVINKLYMWE